MHTVTDEHRSIVASRGWYHSFEVLPGLWTPGRQKHRLDTGHVLSDLHGIPNDLSGKRALDIGALDGPYSFELERRGADTTALDIQLPDVVGFNTAKALRQSNAAYVQGNVYDLASLFPKGHFDVILFFGVWYHLKNPMRAFEQINSVLSIGGLLAAEGECLLNTIDMPDPHPDIEAIAKSALPISIFFPEKMKGDPSSWYAPNPACVRAWLTAASFDLGKEVFEDAKPHQRMRVTATKNERAIPVDNPVW